jgi:hypothetical protein
MTNAINFNAKAISCLIGIVVFIVLVTHIQFSRMRRMEDPVLENIKLNWLKNGRDLEASKNFNYMKKAKIFPFRTGCPNNCYRYRQKRLLKNESLYRLNSRWILCDRKSYLDAMDYEKIIKRKNQIDYFVKRFDKLERTLRDEITKLKSSIAALNHLNFSIQRQIHLTLGYHCCLTKREISLLKAVYLHFLTQRDIDFTVGFHGLECWLEQSNSITIIAIVDFNAEVELMKFNRALERDFQSNHVPSILLRSDQMPFHVTVLGVHLGDENSNRKEDNIEPYGDQICAVVHNISLKEGNLGTSSTKSITINFIPELSKPRLFQSPEW